MPNVTNVRDIQLPASVSSMNNLQVTSKRTEATGVTQPRKRVLFLTHRVPYPPDRGDRIRAFHILQFLAARYDVSLAAVSDEPVTSEQMQVIESFTQRVSIQKINAKWGKLRGLLSLAIGGAVSPAYFYRPALARTIAAWHREQPFDAVVTFCTGMVRYARAITVAAPLPLRERQGEGRVNDNNHSDHHTEAARPTLPQPLPQRVGSKNPIHIIDLVDVDSAKWAEYANHSKFPMRLIYATEAKRLRAIEAGEHDHFDAIGVVSEAEANIYRSEVGHHRGLTVLRHAVDTQFHQPMPDANSKTIVFIGVLNYKPNVEGIIWFVRHVMPLLREQVPDVKLQIIGRHPSPQVTALSTEANVEVVGSVPDVRDYLRNAVASIAPLQIARGVQTKVLEAMASGRVAVCSKGAAEGIHGNDGEHLLVCDSPVQWAATLTRVITDPALRSRLATQARHRIEDQYRWEKCYEPLEKLINRQDDQPLRKAA